MSHGYDHEVGQYVIDPETKKPRMLTEQCATCVGRGGNVAGLRPGRLQELVSGNRDGLGLICHETLISRDGETPPEAFCRWYYETYGSNYQRICERLGGFTEVPPPPDPRVDRHEQAAAD